MTRFAAMMHQHFGVKPKGYRAKRGTMPKHVAINVLRQVEAETGVSIDDMLGTCRLRPFAYARQEAFSRFRALGYSYEEIGRTMRRDHSTVHYGVRQAAAR